ncbi:ferredoxin family protein [Paenibacillus sp. FSL H8-0537]|uniref:4Fe-4S dicluster domain-containing protein n=1 Tax=Paenibacillus sp. FSL H8-0537 TaxID=2921399 RepID=UPI003101AD53
MRKPPAAAARASEQQPTKETVKSVTELIIEIYFINPDICIDCGACEAACPVEAVYYEEDLSEQQIKYAAKAREFFKTQ